MPKIQLRTIMAGAVALSVNAARGDDFDATRSIVRLTVKPVLAALAMGASHRVARLLAVSQRAVRILVAKTRAAILAATNRTAHTLSFRPGTCTWLGNTTATRRSCRTTCLARRCFRPATSKATLILVSK